MDEKKKEEDAAKPEKSTVGTTLGGAVVGAVAGTALGVPVVSTVGRGGSRMDDMRNDNAYADEHSDTANCGNRLP